MPNISLVTYAGQTVTPLDDALVYETAINQSGMIYGGTVTIKNANNIHISSGHGMVCGRKFTIFESDIQVALSSSGTLLGRLYVQLDLSNVGTPVQLLVETGASLTPVVQEKNVNIMNGVYEFNLATFTVDTSTISNIVNVAPSAEPSTGAGSVITITTSEASLQGKMCTITDGTTTLNANFDNTGTAIFYGVQMVGTVIVNATDGTYYASGQITITYFGKYSTSIAFWGATVNLSTTTPEFYGQTISITQDGILVGTTSFDGSGSATYIAPAVGTYIFTVTYGGNDYSATVNVASQTTYSATINQNNGLTLEAWITAGSTTEYPLNPSSYADFSALEADEAAVRQLMTVHASVDYLAQATAGDSLMESVINSDVCAKWINLRDYALDTLSANANIKSVMDTADKYGYGEWGIIDSTTTPPTWGALGNVPIMTANNAPYGTANASSYASSSYLPYKAFTQDYNSWSSGQNQGLNSWLSYTFVTPVKVKRFRVMNEFDSEHDPRVQEYQVIGVNNGAETVLKTVRPDDYTDYEAYGSYHIYFVDIDDDKCDYYSTYKLLVTSVNTNGALYASFGYIQFYGRELTQTLSSAPTDGREYVQIGTTYYTEDWGEKEFESGSTAKWIYDHGVELETLVTDTTTATQTVEKGSDSIYINHAAGVNGGAGVYHSADITDYKSASMTFGNRMYNTSPNSRYPGMYVSVDTTVYGLQNNTNPNFLNPAYPLVSKTYSMDISQINGIYNVWLMCGTQGTANGCGAEFVELYLEK